MSASLEAVAVGTGFTDAGGSRIVALDDVSARFEAGQLSAIVGPSGSGKTTLLHALAGIVVVQAGHIRFAGHDLNAATERARDAWRLAHCGMVFQDFRLIGEIDAMSNILLPARFTHLRMPAALRDRAASLLARFGMAARNGPVARLSRGEQQRVALARALLLDPPIVLADEPTASLDAESGRQIAEALRQVADEGRMVIAVTHDEKLARLADRRLTMTAGRLA